MARYRVTANSLNVRSEPGMSGTIIGALQTNDAVEFLEASSDGYWYRISSTEITGWVAQKYLVPLTDVEAPTEEFPWLPIALGELGVSEVRGPQANPRIVQYLQSTSLSASEASTDETAWCSGFVNWCMEQAGFAGTDSAWALNWIRWGSNVDEPRRGCITVFRRRCQNDPPGEKNCGHVAFFIAETSTHVRVLGGNQGNSVSYAEYPKDDVLGYRLPA